MPLADVLVHLSVNMNHSCHCISQHRYQLTPHVKLKDIQGLYTYYGTISSYGDQHSLVLWSLLNVNNDYILVNDLYCLLTALLFDGHSLICDPRSHTDSIIDCLDHGEECTELPPMDCNYHVMQLFFTWLQTDVVKMTLAETMQHACIPLNSILRKHYKSPHPALNVMKHNELVYMDAAWSDAPTIDWLWGDK